jgi:hypothetical protein
MKRGDCSEDCFVDFIGIVVDLDRIRTFLPDRTRNRDRIGLFYFEVSVIWADFPVLHWFFKAFHGSVLSIQYSILSVDGPPWLHFEPHSSLTFRGSGLLCRGCGFTMPEHMKSAYAPCAGIARCGVRARRSCWTWPMLSAAPA